MSEAATGRRPTGRQRARRSTRRTAAAAGACFCGGIGPALTQIARGLPLSDDLLRQWRATEREVLQLLRAVIDLRLAALGRDPADEGRASRGTSVPVE